jgi:dCTP deaminase
MQINNSSLLGKKEIVRRLTEKNKTKRIIVSPILSSSQIQPASLDIRLGPDFLIIKIGKITHLDPLRSPDSVKFEVERYTDKYKILNKYERFILHPNEFILGCTLEYVQLPIDIAARLEGRSSWGRLGLMVHSTAGFIDPGFCGNITFELKNMGKVPVPLYPGIRMGQLSFFEVDNDEKYEGKYLESFGVIPSRYFDDYEFREIRKTYSKESFEDVVIEIFESVMNEGPCPRTKYPDRFPQELVEAIALAFKRHSGEYSES